MRFIDKVIYYYVIKYYVGYFYIRSDRDFWEVRINICYVLFMDIRGLVEYFN